MRSRPLALCALLALTACPAPAPRTDAGPDATLDALADAAPEASPEASAPDAGPLVRCPGPFAAPTANELATRRRLGIPEDAPCVLLLAQTSHMDVDWQHTFDQYYGLFVGDILSGATQLVGSEPAYRYQVAEMAFLAEHTRRHPEQLPTLRDAVTRGAYQLVGGGMTSPDTLLPTTEALARDFLRGSLYAENTLGARARSAWLPDSFGHAPTVPDLLAGLGYRAVAFARVDGLHDALEALHGQPQIVRGSFAAQLRDQRSADFVWVGPGGGEVLAHWLPVRLYCQGDGIDHTGAPAPGGYLTGEDRSNDPAYVNAELASFVTEMQPYVQTPYLFVPIGCDFQLPHPRLAEHARRWNAEQYASTGVYVALGSFDDYAELLADRRASLPRMQRDIAPYFSGYLGSRLGLKGAIREAGELLGQAELAAVLAQSVAAAPFPAARVGALWDSFARTDHHDFIAGTALDDVTLGEQAPLVESVRSDAAAVLASSVSALANAVAPDPAGVASVLVLGTTGAPGPRLAQLSVTLSPGRARDLGASVPVQILSSTRAADGTLQGARVLLALPAVAPASYQRVTLTDTAGQGPVAVQTTGNNLLLSDASAALAAVVDNTTGQLTSLRFEGQEYLSGPSLGLEGWHDEGGLYRLGNESQGCAFTSLGAVRSAPTVTVLERGPVRARVRVARADGSAVEYSLVAGARRVDVSVDAAAMEGQTLTARVASRVATAQATFVHAAGSVRRPAQYLYDPTFWPVVRGLDLARDDGSGLALLTGFSTGAHFDGSGGIDVMVARNAVSEQCDILGAEGHEVVRRALRFALRPHSGPLDVLAENLAMLDAPAAQVGPSGTAAPAASLLSLSGAGWVLSAVKPADRGAGTLLRFERTRAGAVTLGAGLLTPASLTRTDLLERDRGALLSPVTLDEPTLTVRAR